MARKIVIGDIHGALKALEQLLVIVDIREDDLLIFLGDYVDGWPQSAEVIEYLISLDKRQPCIFIKGNHDAWCESWLMGATPDPDWLYHGGKETINSYIEYTADQKAIHLNFFQSFRNYYVDETNRLFIHAGFSTMQGPVNDDYGSDALWDRTLWELALTMDGRVKKDPQSYPKRLLLYHDIFIGHTPTLNYGIVIPMQACNVWNIDTGAAFYGKLSAMNVETKEYWQSDVVQYLYPNDRGRNK